MKNWQDIVLASIVCQDPVEAVLKSDEWVEWDYSFRLGLTDVQRRSIGIDNAAHALSYDTITEIDYVLNIKPLK